MIWVALFLILAAVVMLWLSARKQAETGLPVGRVVYDDSSAWGKVEEPFFDPVLALTGKPDYVLDEDGFQIPVEVKSTPAPTHPYDGHIYQLAAYCLLVERSTGQHPPYGILRYRNRTFAIDFTPELEANLMDMLEEMRFVAGESQKKRYRGPERSHEARARCARCGYRSTCDQNLVVES